MKHLSTRTAAILLTGVAIFGFSGCGGTDGTSSQTQLVGNPTQDVKKSPVAVAKVDPSEAVIGDTVTVDGSASYDPDGFIVRWVWSVNGSVVGEGKIVQVPTAGLEAGTYEITLTVVDNDSYTATDTVKATLIKPKTVLPLCTEELGTEPWTSDGTTAGTTLLKDINEGPVRSVPGKIGGNDHNKKFVQIRLKTFFPASMQHTDENNNTYETVALWVSEGTPESTVMLKDFNNTDERGLAQMVEMGGELYFRGWDEDHGYQIWKSDGTPESTVQVTNIPGDPNDLYSNSIGGLRSLGDIVTFHAETEEYGLELWKTDGTAAGTSIVKDIMPGSDDSSVESFKVVDGKLYFSAYSLDENNDSTGREPWVSDGTEIGTHMIADMREGSNSSSPYGFTGYNGEVYFTADGEDENGTYLGRELYKTDGTVDGTVLVKDIRPDSDSSYPRSFKVFNGLLYFRAYDGSGRTLWKTDGSNAGTVRVFDGTEWDDLDPESIIAASGKLFFRADDSDYDYNLYMYDGVTSEPTVVATDENSTYAHNFRVVDDTLWFMMYSNDQDETSALWRTDGTETVKIKDQLCSDRY